MATNNYVTTNEYVPTLVVTDPNGRTSSNPDLEFKTLLSSERNFSNLLKRHAYERLNDTPTARANPPFSTGAAGRLTSLVTSSNGGNPPEILRGYIRRSNMNSSDPTGGYRLYFMFNPETIQRNYVAYLEQGALDPFNTIYGSNNLVAPPGVLDFQFTLLFDRQTENATGAMPRGVLEDFKYFDLVVRGVIEDGTPQLQDNGIMMINPRNVTVVFSPQLSIQGRPYRASVNYTKFDHTMTPIRMEINLSMKIYYFGPLREDFTFSSTKDEGNFEATIPYDEGINYTITAKDIGQARLDNPDPDPGTAAAALALENIQTITSGTNANIRLDALRQAESLGEARVKYAYANANPRPILLDPTIHGLDCSGLVIWAYWKLGALEAIGQRPGEGNTWSLMDFAATHGLYVAGGSSIFTFNDFFIENGLQPGDLLIGPSHVAFCVSVDKNTKQVNTYESNPVYQGPKHGSFPYSQIYGNPNYHTGVIRPKIAGRDTIGGPLGGFIN